MGFHFFWKQIISASLLVFLFTTCFSNKMDPHVFPQNGSFFEEWYLRIIDHQQNISLCFFFGQVLPSDRVKKKCPPPTSDLYFTECVGGSRHLAFLGLLLSLEPGGKLDNPVGYFTPDQYNMAINGKPVVNDPDDMSPANFELHISKNFSFVVDPQSIKFNLTLNEHQWEGVITNHVPWGPAGEGPEGVLINLPLSIHWFVYSVRSTVPSYKYLNSKTGKTINGSSSQGVPVVAHIEKYWSQSFPGGWMWSQGINPKSGVSYVFSIAKVPVSVTDLQVQLAGYRNPEKSISCSFNPANSFYSLKYDGCAGFLKLEVWRLLDFCKVIYEVSAPPETSSFCLGAPLDVGLAQSCVASYVGVTKITVFQFRGLVLQETDSQILNLTSLEFGKDFMCNRQCTLG